MEQLTNTTSAFKSLGVSDETCAAVADMGYEQPTQVQTDAIPKALQGIDLVVMSRTGTGKTASFGIPLVDKIDAGLSAPQSLVLAPTRELAVQVAEELEKIGRGRGLKCQAIYGGDSMVNQVEGLRDGAQVIAGTPGRVLDHLRRGSLNLDHLQVLVLDEADKMLDMGFAQEMSDILQFVPSERQTLLFSATIPVGIRAIIYNYLSDPEWVLLSEDFAYVKEVRHSYIIAPQMRKDDILFRILEHDAPSSSMIFCNTKGEVRNVTSFLETRGLPVAMISSDLNQRQREKVMGLFRSGEIRHLVATDVAARGIDIDDLSHVFIFSTPDSPESYIHRAGRTGRSGKSGDVISLVAAQDLVSFNRLEKRYHLASTERTVPTDEDLRELRRTRLLASLHEGVSKLSDSDRKRLKPSAEALLEELDSRRRDGDTPEAVSVAAYLLRCAEDTDTLDSDSSPRGSAQSAVESEPGSASDGSQTPANPEKKPRRRRRRRRD